MQIGNILQPLLSGATTGTSQIVPINAFTSLDVTITATAALSAGTLLVEESDDPGYAGTWSLIENVNLASVFASAGGKSVRHYANSSYQFVRTRIGTTAVGGTISTSLGAA